MHASPKIGALTAGLYIFATKARIDNLKKIVKQQYLLHMSLQYGEVRSTSGWDHFVSLMHPSKFQRVSRLGSITAQHCSSGRQPNFAMLNRGRHLYIRQGGHHVGHWPTFLIYPSVYTSMSTIVSSSNSNDLVCLLVTVSKMWCAIRYS